MCRQIRETLSQHQRFGLPVPAHLPSNAPAICRTASLAIACPILIFAAILPSGKGSPPDRERSVGGFPALASFSLQRTPLRHRPARTYFRPSASLAVQIVMEPLQRSLASAV